MATLQSPTHVHTSDGWKSRLNPLWISFQVSLPFMIRLGCIFFKQPHVVAFLITYSTIHTSNSCCCWLLLLQSQSLACCLLRVLFSSTCGGSRSLLPELHFISYSSVASRCLLYAMAAAAATERRRDEEEGGVDEEEAAWSQGDDRLESTDYRPMWALCIWSCCRQWSDRDACRQLFVCLP